MHDPLIPARPRMGNGRAAEVAPHPTLTTQDNR